MPWGVKPYTLVHVTRRFIGRVLLAADPHARPLTAGRSRASVAKAASISPLVLAFRTWICSTMVRAASCTSRSQIPAHAGSVAPIRCGVILPIGRSQHAAPLVGANVPGGIPTTEAGQFVFDRRPSF
jgi:hypothetical protein